MDLQPEVRKQNKGTQHNFSIDAILKVSRDDENI